MTKKNFEERIMQAGVSFQHVVPFSGNDTLLLMDFSQSNKEISPEILQNTDHFIHYINQKLNRAGARYGIGGYLENRFIYSKSALFNGPVAGLFQKPIPSPSRREGSGAPYEDESTTENDLIEDPEFGYHWADPTYYNILKEYCIQNRKQPTQAEEILWQAVKGKRLGEHKFRRQHIIDKYIADLVCLDKRLIIEIDGLIHELPENIIYDAARTKSLEESGFIVLRITNDQVLNDLNSTLNKILLKLNSLPSIKAKTDLSSPSGGQGAARTIHLGIDIWGKPYTKVMAPLDGIVHSFAFNNAFGDYGTTIILSHQVNGFTFHTLYGHLSLNSITNIQEGDLIKKGDVFAAFGIPYENGHWPPHLHFQIIIDMKGMKGDYPGVCTLSDVDEYKENSPDPDVILQMMKYVEKRMHADL